jgi:hypothetical protein
MYLKAGLKGQDAAPEQQAPTSASGHRHPRGLVLGLCMRNFWGP